MDWSPKYIYSIGPMYTYWNTCDQLKLFLTKWAQTCDCSPVVNASKTKPENAEPSLSKPIKNKFTILPCVHKHTKKDSSIIEEF